MASRFNVLTSGRASTDGHGHRFVTVKVSMPKTVTHNERVNLVVQWKPTGRDYTTDRPVKPGKRKALGVGDE